MRDRLFVYGTLRPANRHPMGRVLANNARRLGRGAIRGHLARIGAYPALVHEPAGGWVEGEIFEFAGGRCIWHVLDAYEGCHDTPPDYERRRLWVRLASGRHVAWIAAWCYIVKPPEPPATGPAGNGRTGPGG